MAATNVGPLLVNATTTGPGEFKTPTGANRTYFLSVIADSGANGSASIDIEISLDNIDWLKIGTVSFSNIGDTKEYNSFSSLAAYLHVRANIKSISGAGMTINATYGVNQ